MSGVDRNKRRRHGPAPLDASVKRVHTVSVRLNDDELALLDSRREGVQMQRGEYLRAAALHRLPHVVPAVNREQWAELSRLAANLNQLTRLMHQGGMTAVSALAADVSDTLVILRRLLIGAVVDLQGLGDDESER